MKVWSSVLAALLLPACASMPSGKQLLDSAKGFVVGAGGTSAPADKPMLAALKGGAFVKSNEAIGEERDVANMRIVHGLVVLPRLTDYANSVLDKLKAASSHTGIPGRVHIVASEQLDSGATADGNVFVSLGYFRSLESEDELAALLGHELAHVVLHHHDSSWLGRKQKEMMSWFESGSQLRNLARQVMDARYGSTRAGASAQPASQLTSGQREQLERMELLVKLNDRALHPAWNRTQEAAADRLGADLMIAAGYSFSDGVTAWLAKVEEWDRMQAKERERLAAERQAAVETLAAQGNFQGATKTALDGQLKDVLDDFARSHEGGDKRLQDIVAYSDQAYGDQLPDRRRNAAAYQLAQRDSMPTLESYREVFQARNRVVQREFAAVLPALQRLTAPGSPIAGHAIPNYLLFEAQRGLGRAADGMPALQRSLAAPERTWEPFESGAAYYGSRGQRDEIVAIGRDAFQSFAAAPAAYPRLVAMYNSLGLKDEAQKAAAECRSKQPDMRMACDKAAR